MTQLYRFGLCIGLSLASTLVWAKSSPVQDNIREEVRWQKWARAMAASNFSLSLKESSAVRASCLTLSCATDFDSLLNALAEGFDSGVVSKEQVGQWMDWSASQPLALEERAQLAWTFKSVFPARWEKAQALLVSKEKQLAGGELSPRFEQMMSYVGADEKVAGTDDAKQFAPVPIDANRVQLARDLITQNPPIDQYGDGSYAKGVRIYMFCRDDRHYPCLMVMRNANGTLVKENGKIWTNKSLGYSRVEKKYDQTNGNTPAGIFLIDGVMPVADQQTLFGKFRRLVLNFPEPSANEEKFKLLLPDSSHKAHWWSEGKIARNLGRNSFRVHGTLRPAPTGTTYFPFLGTGGCVAQRENTYNGVTYADQRHLLDDLMTALGLPAVYDNEVQIKGLLYVMNIDNTKKAVELSDLQRLKVVP